MCTERRQAGFTLVELIFFIVVVALGLAGILSVMNTGVARSADPLVRKQTIAVAESLLEEILLKDFADPPGGYTGPTRALFDDVGDYAGYTTAGGMRDMAGNPVAGLGPYNVTGVVVTPMALSGIPALRVTVTVTGPDGAIDLTGYRTNN